MRYALDARTLTSHFPGIGRYVGNLARALAEELAPEERLILLWNPRAAPHWDGELPQAENVEWVEVAASPFSLRQQWLVPRVLRRSGATMYHSPYYLMPYRSGLPTVLTLYDAIPELHPRSVSLAPRRAFRVATKLALRSASRVLTPSEATRRDLLERHRLDPERVTVTPLAASPRLRPRSEAERRRVRETLGLPESYVLYLGTAKPHKNLERLLEAWKMLTRPPALVLAGVGKGLRSSGTVRFLGEVAEDDLPALLSAATLFVFPSLHEGFGLPVVEAMACGVPVVCSEGSSLTEITADAALRFDPGDARALAQTIGRALADESLRSDLARRGLERAKQYCWRRTATLTLHVYRSLLTR